MPLRKRSEDPTTASTTVGGAPASAPAKGAGPVGPDRPDTATPRPGVKGRPTPRRAEAEAARRKPLVVVDRKAAAREARAKAKAVRDAEYQALQAGDERNMPLRDRGPVRRYARDVVDARRNLGELFLPAAIVLLFSTLLMQVNPSLGFVVVVLLYGFVIATIVDAVFLWRRLRRQLEAKFGDKVPPGTPMYGVLRAFQMRRTRMPRPKVERGQHPS